MNLIIYMNFLEIKKIIFGNILNDDIRINDNTTRIFCSRAGTCALFARARFRFSGSNLKMLLALADFLGNLKSRRY